MTPPREGIPNHGALCNARDVDAPASAPVTVCFVARADFESKPGGDTVQWQMYDHAARQAGLRVTTWFDDSPMPRADVFHAFNIGRPLELYPKLAEDRRLRLPFVMSAIHHPHPWLVRFRRFQPPTGFLGRWLYRSPIGRSVPASETAREVALLLRQRRLTYVGDLRRSWAVRVRWLLAEAARVALLSRAEAASVGADLGYDVRPAQALVLPNWAEGLGEAPAAAPALFRELPEAPVIVVGRIEPRKNSVRICRLAEVARRHVVFVGRPHPGERGFVEAFRQATQASRYTRWIPGVSRSEMAQFYGHGRFLLNASFVEVSPLVDIEALSFGCPIVTTKYALHHELLPPNTPVCEPYDEHSILEWLRWRPDRAEPRPVVDAERCKRTLVETYRELARAGAG